MVLSFFVVLSKGCVSLRGGGPLRRWVLLGAMNYFQCPNSIVALCALHRAKGKNLSAVPMGGASFQT
ncbi:hypothetical protein [Porphyromonas gingivicanis]|uniref:hypothetical protein n=1 Tax=Porphyromonas gingivicanis TaxID=266762 RepID=UPI0011DDB292|nr:hypothetical protein [Porphyromonas gingivicanis]